MLLKAQKPVSLSDQCYLWSMPWLSTSSFILWRSIHPSFYEALVQKQADSVMQKLKKKKKWSLSISYVKF